MTTIIYDSGVLRTDSLKAIHAANGNLIELGEKIIKNESNTIAFACTGASDSKEIIFLKQRVAEIEAVRQSFIATICNPTMSDEVKDIASKIVEQLSDHIKDSNLQWIENSRGIFISKEYVFEAAGVNIYNKTDSLFPVSVGIYAEKYHFYKLIGYTAERAFEQMLTSCRLSAPPIHSFKQSSLLSIDVKDFLQQIENKVKYAIAKAIPQTEEQAPMTLVRPVKKSSSLRKNHAITDTSK